MCPPTLTQDDEDYDEGEEEEENEEQQQGVKQRGTLVLLWTEYNAMPAHLAKY
jgi:hypothetical protein